MPAPAKVNWDEIREKYEVTKIKVTALASQYGLTEGAIRRKAKAGDWKRIANYSDHIDQKVLAIQKVKEIDRKELAIASEPIRKKINEEVQTKLSLIEQYSRINQKITNRLFGYLDHDSRIIQDPNTPIEAQEVGKLKMYGDILKVAKQNVLGDTPLMEMEEAELVDDEDDEKWCVVIPAQEKLRVDAIKEKTR